MRRIAVVVKWDPAADELAGAEFVNLVCTRGDDVSTRNAILNDGNAVVTYPEGFHGTTVVRVVPIEALPVEVGEGLEFEVTV